MISFSRLLAECFLRSFCLVCLHELRLSCRRDAGGGPFNRLSTLLAHNYLVHFPLKSELVFKDREIEFDVQRLVTHTRSFLTSLNL